MEKVDFIKEIYFFFEQYLILSLNQWVCVRARVRAGKKIVRIAKGEKGSAL